jgi:hypothetical protein
VTYDLAPDISNYTSAITAAEIACWRLHGVTRAIVQAVDPPPQYPRGVTREQLQILADNSMPADAYVYLWFSLGLDDVRRKLQLLDGFRIGRLWLDVEDTAHGRPEVLISDALAVLAAYPADDPPGIYTGKWWWDRYMTESRATVFSSFPLWASQYDGIPDPTVWTPFGGWTTLAVKQHQGTTQLCGVTGLDMNVYAPQEVQAPVAIHVGSGMKAQMDMVGDQPLSGHKFYDEVDDDGKTYNVEECMGTKGRYISSNVDGNWVNGGPF